MNTAINNNSHSLPLRPARRRGAVLVIVLISMTLLVGLVFFALNVGTQVNSRLTMQNAADSTVISGAGWMARSMNVVAMNNVAQSRMIAQAAVLDALPLAAEMTIAEETGQQSLPLALQQWRNVGRAFTPYEKDNFFRLGLAELYRQMQTTNEQTKTHLELLQEIDETFDQDDELVTEDGYNVKPTTQWEYAGTAQFIEDDSDAGFSTTGAWTKENMPLQYSQACYTTSSPDAVATWTRKVPQNGRYRIYARWPKGQTDDELNPSAKFQISQSGQKHSAIRNQNINAGKWVKLGQVELSSASPVTITLTHQTSNTEIKTVADAIRFETDSGSSRRGYLWRAATAMDQLSQATTESVSERCQENAVRYGEANGAKTAFVLPIEPKLPVKRGDFGDFEPVLVDHIEYNKDTASVKESDLVNWLYNSTDTAFAAREKTDENGAIERIRGWLAFPDYVSGGALPNFEFPHRLGPFAALYRWRFNWERYQYTFDKRMGYTSYGPYEDALRQVMQGFGMAGWFWHSGITDTSRFAYHLRTLTKIKLAYMFKKAHTNLPERDLYAQYSDQWITDYEQAEELAHDELEQQAGLQPGQSFKSEIMTTRYYRVQVRSTVPWGSSHWMKHTSWQSQPPTMSFTPRRWFSWQLSGRGPYDDPTKFSLHRWIYDRHGWSPIGHAMPYAQAKATPWNDHPEGQWIEIDPSGHVWYRKWQTKQQYDRELQLPERLKPDGSYETYTIYRIEWRVFGGIELRNEVAISDPTANANLDSLPAPTILDVTEGDYEAQHDTGHRRDKFTYLGVASCPGTAKVWPRRFTPGNPSDKTTALAQAIVFNNTSWDLWTQDWRAKLVPVSKWQDWTDKINDDIENIGDAGGTIDQAAAQELMNYLNTLDPEFMDLFLNH